MISREHEKSEIILKENSVEEKECVLVDAKKSLSLPLKKRHMPSVKSNEEEGTEREIEHGKKETNSLENEKTYSEQDERIAALALISAFHHSPAPPHSNQISSTFVPSPATERSEPCLDEKEDISSAQQHQVFETPVAGGNENQKRIFLDSNSTASTTPSTEGQKETRKLGEILEEFQSKSRGMLSNPLAVQLFGNYKTNLLFGTAALERSRRTKRNIERYEDTAMIKQVKKQKSSQQSPRITPERVAVAPKSFDEEDQSTNKVILLNSILDSKRWIGRTVIILAGKLKGRSAIVTGVSQNGWVHLLLTATDTTTSRRAQDLQLSQNNSSKIIQ